MESNQTATAIKWIDSVLDYLSAPVEGESIENSIYTRYSDENLIWQHLILIFPEMNVEAFRATLPRILDKLDKDGYVQRKEIPFEGVRKTGYVATFEGELFSQNGGYRAKLDASNAENIRTDRLEVAQQKYQKSTVILTAILAIGVIPPFLWYCRELTKLLAGEDALSCAILLFFGMCIGIPITLLIQELVENK